MSRVTVALLATALLVIAASAVAPTPGDSSQGLYDSSKYTVVSGPDPAAKPKTAVVAKAPVPAHEENIDKDVPIW